ncbi:hypothetical protein NSQ61_19700 [Aeribacillus sp. FSL K6-1121]|uniref:hypothetical protein n=1 Tax=Aeribacillus sp. FSL K6-1121 TaxID=2954745 RepID=UPI0030F5AA17
MWYVDVSFVSGKSRSVCFRSLRDAEEFCDSVKRGAFFLECDKGIINLNNVECISEIKERQEEKTAFDEYMNRIKEALD